MKPLGKDARIVLLHHSTGRCVWNGGVPEWFQRYNTDNGTNYRISEMDFPKKEPYGWRNYPYDYWNIWVNHAGDEPFMEQPTLEMLTKNYDVIVFKHCFPVSAILPDTGAGDVADEEKRLENYKLQYEALKAKLRQLPDTRFVVWTAAALVADRTDEDQGLRTRQFASWVKDKWCTDSDNISVWDFYEVETDGGLFLKDEYSAKPGNSHPNEQFCRKAAPLLCEAIVSAVQA